MRILKLSVAFVIVISFFNCSPDNSNDENSSEKDNQEKAGFEVISNELSGVTFVNTLSDNPLSEKNILSYPHYFNGAGVGVGDFNNDGLQDIFFAGNEVPNELYINQGGFKFEKLPESCGININKVWAAGVSIVDINQDGFDDIYVSQQGPNSDEERRNVFYINKGDLTFEESAAAMGLADNNYSTQAGFFDYDKDGDLDCYIMDESKYAGVILQAVYDDLEDEENMKRASGKLYRNDGNLKFTNVTKEAGVLNYGYGLGLAISDFNNDNWPDIYVANDYTVPDFMYINQKDGTFKESIKSYTRQLSYFGMGCDVADINNDGLVDIGVVDMAAEDHQRDKTLMAGMDVESFRYYFYKREYQFQYMFNSLQLNNGNNTFSNIAAVASVLKSDWSWAALFSDFDLDGNKDYYVSNGFRRYARDNDFRAIMAKSRDENNGVVPMNQREAMYKLMPEIKLKNKLYMNDGELHFSDKEETFTHPNIETYSYGVALADFDNDGDMDLVINNIDQNALILKNTTREKTNRNYLKISLDEINPAKKLNAKITIYYGDKIQLQEYFFVRGYESTMEESLIFGLGDVTKIDKMEVLWPDGNVQTINNISTNQHLKVKYVKEQELKQAKETHSYFSSMSSSESGLKFKHKENEFDDFQKEILLPQRQSAFGPALTSADVNHDGLDDIYIGGANRQAGVLYLQLKNGTFEQAKSQPWANEHLSEDVAAAFVDANQDGHQDLIVLSGGSGDFVGNEHLLVDRFYANKGDGTFVRIANVLPESFTASYAIIAENIDNDPELELLIIGAAKPGKYPQKEDTKLYDYIGNKYVDITNTLIPEINSQEGLIRDAEWVDLNGDNIKDLITVGEWQSPEIYVFNEGKYQRQSDAFGVSDSKGWWRSIAKCDLDNDGDFDFVIGNVGKNFKQKATKDYPLYLYSNDFDNNGTLDCVLAKEYNGKVVPTRGKQCSTEQMPFVSEKYKTYADYAAASIVDIYGQNKLDEGIKLVANDFYSYILWNDSGQLTFQKLPVLAQISPINDIVFIDVNNDGKKDIIVGGNDYNTEYETPRLDAGNGLLMLNKGNKVFESQSVNASGIFCPGDVKRIIHLKSNGKDMVVFGNNNDSVATLILK